MKKSTDLVLEYFTELSRIPRQSGQEAGVREWLKSWAGKHNFTFHADKVGNVVVEVPATPGHESAAPIALQGHMDMVCEKTPDSTHDFTRDPIIPRRDGEWLTADRTTLGADNGIGMALSMAAATAPDLSHGRMELLFTVDEETGLIGATEFQAELLTARILINIDSDLEGVFTVGCAGGRNTEVELPVTYRKSGPDGVAVTISIAGLRGGHSGVNIAEVRGNANVLLARVVQRCIERYGASVASFSGGSAHNAIARDAEALIVVDEIREHAHFLKEVAKEVAAWQETFRGELRDAEPAITVTVKQSGRPERTFDEASSRKLVDLVLALPHGVIRMSPVIAALVQTSTNLASVRTESAAQGSTGKVNILTSQRSLSMSELDAATGAVSAVARLAGAVANTNSSYPSWEPRTDSPLLTRSVATYRELFGREPVVDVIHAGLECGVIGSKVPGMDMISFGPTITGAHSPVERLHVPAVEKVWQFLCALTESLGS